MLDRLSITGDEAAAVVVSTVGIYLTFVLLLRFVGRRMVSGLGPSAIAAAMALGALVGRTILGDTPVLAAGILGLVTLTALEGILAPLRDTDLGSRLLTPAPVLLVADGRLLREQMRRAHVVESEIWSRLRVAGVPSLDHAAAVVLEPDGSISVLTRGEPIDRALLAGVRGADAVPDSLISR